MLRICSIQKGDSCEGLMERFRQVLSGLDDWVSTATVIRETYKWVLGMSSGQRRDDKETFMVEQGSTTEQTENVDRNTRGRNIV